MLQHKRTLAGILAATMMFSLTACGGGGATKDPGSDAAQDPNEAAAAGTLQLSEWEESSGIFNTDETDEELYEKAIAAMKKYNGLGEDDEYDID